MDDRAWYKRLEELKLASDKYTVDMLRFRRKKRNKHGHIFYEETIEEGLEYTGAFPEVPAGAQFNMSFRAFLQNEVPFIASLLFANKNRKSNGQTVSDAVHIFRNLEEHWPEIQNYAITSDHEEAKRGVLEDLMMVDVKNEEMQLDYVRIFQICLSLLPSLLPNTLNAIMSEKDRPITKIRQLHRFFH
ncbi:hypothetical protein HK097_009880 [Rhizophlyctis rosea]|uniref:Uncharacterized protein n=1 Tax=Rhizophlyctis rosea TaxID=64517 RepID=A0AAD5X0T2_9FUNG|nr:hypothetical protein HK097_009880 [Rhizophlyctis rosea]